MTFIDGSLSSSYYVDLEHASFRQPFWSNQILLGLKRPQATFQDVQRSCSLAHTVTGRRATTTLKCESGRCGRRGAVGCGLQPRAKHWGEKRAVTHFDVWYLRTWRVELRCLIPREVCTKVECLCRWRPLSSVSWKALPSYDQHKESFGRSTFIQPSGIGGTRVATPPFLCFLFWLAERFRRTI